MCNFGLVEGSVIGGPLANKLIENFNLRPEEYEKSNYEELDEVSLKDDGTYFKISKKLSESNLINESMQIIIAMGLGTIVSNIFSEIGITMPGYIGAMIVSAIMRNISDIKEIWTISES